MRALAALAILAAVIVAGLAAAQRVRVARQEAKAEDFIGAMARGDFTYGLVMRTKADFLGKVSTREERRRLQTAARREAQWQEICGQLGAYQRMLGTHPGTEPGTVVVPCEFAMGRADLVVTFNKQDQVAGYGVGPSRQ